MTPTHQLSCSHWTAWAAATVLPQVAWLPAHRKPLSGSALEGPLPRDCRHPAPMKGAWVHSQPLGLPCLISFLYSYRSIRCAHGWPAKGDISQLLHLLGRRWWRRTRNVKALNFQATLLKRKAPSSPVPCLVFLFPWLDADVLAGARAAIFSQGRSRRLKVQQTNKTGSWMLWPIEASTWTRTRAEKQLV